MAEEKKVVEEVKEEKAPVTLEELHESAKKAKKFFILSTVFWGVTALMGFTGPLAVILAPVYVAVLVTFIVFFILKMINAIKHIIKAFTFKGEDLPAEEEAFANRTKVFAILATVLP